MSSEYFAASLKKHRREQIDAAWRTNYVTDVPSDGRWCQYGYYSIESSTNLNFVGTIEIPSSLIRKTKKSASIFKNLDKSGFLHLSRNIPKHRAICRQGRTLPPAAKSWPKMMDPMIDYREHFLGNQQAAIVVDNGRLTLLWHGASSPKLNQFISFCKVHMVVALVGRLNLNQDVLLPFYILIFPAVILTSLSTAVLFRTLIGKGRAGKKSEKSDAVRTYVGNEIQNESSLMNVRSQFDGNVVTRFDLQVSHCTCSFLLHVHLFASSECYCVHWQLSFLSWFSALSHKGTNVWLHIYTIGNRYWANRTSDCTYRASL